VNDDGENNDRTHEERDKASLLQRWVHVRLRPSSSCLGTDIDIPNELLEQY
jgi:hypothetical protein